MPAAVANVWNRTGCCQGQGLHKTNSQVHKEERLNQEMETDEEGGERMLSAVLSHQKKLLPAVLSD